MRKFTSKIIDDMWKINFEDYSELTHKLSEKFMRESKLLVASKDLVIQFPNLQISNDISQLWTPDVNYLVKYVCLEYDSDSTNGSIYASPYIVIDGYKIFGFDPKRAHIDGLYKPFYVANKNEANFTEVDGWRENMRSLQMPEKIITEIIYQLNRFYKTGNLKKGD